MNFKASLILSGASAAILARSSMRCSGFDNTVRQLSS